MSSAFQDRKGWIVSFRPPALSGRARRRFRIPARELRAAADPAALARERAAACERLSRLLDVPVAHDPRRVREALALGVLTEPEARRLLGALPPPPAPAFPTLEELARQHPATQREKANDPDSYLRHVRELREFVAWSGVRRIDELALPVVLGYIAHLAAEGRSYYGRRHRLTLIRRAARMGVSCGFPDALAGIVLDRAEAPPEPAAWTFEELVAGLRLLRDEGRGRSLAATALGGLMGLRSSEAFRLRVGDVGEALRVGAHGRKNLASRRDLPIPAVVRPWLEALVSGRSAEAPLLCTHHRGKPGPFSRATYGHWLGPTLARATGRALPPKCLRKTFATWALDAGLDERLLEAWLGHRSGLVAAVTARHYLQKVQARRLVEFAEAISGLVSPLLA